MFKQLEDFFFSHLSNFSLMGEEVIVFHAESMVTGLWCFCQRACIVSGDGVVLLGAQKCSDEVVCSQEHLLLLQGCGINQAVVNSIYKSSSERVLEIVSVSMDGA